MAFLSMEGKKSIILYVDLIHTFEALEDGEAGRLIKHLFRYVNDLSPVAPDKITQIAFEPIKQQLKRDLVKWKETTDIRANSGRLGGIKSGESRRKQKEANEASASKSKQKEANEAVIVNVNDIDIKYPFDSFWNLYGKKVDAHKCKLKWSKLAEEEKEKIMNVLPEYVLSKPDIVYRPNPLTWLNGKRWDDEIIEHSNNGQKEYTPKQPPLIG